MTNFDFIIGYLCISLNDVRTIFFQMISSYLGTQTDYKFKETAGK